MHRLRAVCGILGPASFVGGWLLAGNRAPDCSPVRDAISQLAREGAPTRPLMTSAFISFGVLVPVYARALGLALESTPVRRVVTVAGVTTLGVAALPLTREPGGTGDALHALAAGSGYLAMAASPLLGGLALRRIGHDRAAAASFAVSAVSLASLVTSLSPLGEGRTGLFQRAGLTVVDTWFAAIATLLVLRGADAIKGPRGAMITAHD